MSDDNKRNLQYFESHSMRELYKALNKWQIKNRKRLHSVHVSKDADMYCCIALTNPTEVVIVDGDRKDSSQAGVGSASLYVQLKQD
jgi:hypothetical protein